MEDCTCNPNTKKDKPVKEKVTSYRQISLTSCIVKLYDQLKVILVVRKVPHSPLQSKRLPSWETKTRSIDQTNTKYVFQIEEHVTAVIVDPQQACYHVWRSGLLFKPQKMGMQENKYDWIEDFLHDFAIATRVNTSISGKRTLEGGLPQGSAL